MLIGIDASRANREKKTGVEWYAWHVIEKLKDLIPDNIRVVLYSDTELKGELSKLPKNWESKVLHWLPKRFWTQIRLSWEMITNPPNVLFVPSHVFPIIHPKKTIMTVHDVAAIKFPNSYSKFDRWYTIWPAKFAVQNLWKVIVPSEFTKKELLSTGELEGMSDKVNVVHHGYDERYKKIVDREKVEEVLKKYNIKRPYLLSIGRLEERKNTKRIVQSFNQISYNYKTKSYDLVLIGVPGFGYESVKKIIEDSPHKDKIILPGWVDPEDIIYIMNGAEIFVFPSLYEGFGLPIIDAMASGVPVVTSSGLSLEGMVGSACVYVNPEDVWDITKGITEILNNVELRNNKIKEGLSRVGNFSWDRCAEETYKLLRGK